VKKLLKILISLFILALLSLVVFLGVNLWPRKMEAPLWTEADLELPQEKDKNGYYFMLQMQDNPLFEHVFDEISDGMEVPGDLEPFTPRGFPENPTDRTLFWMEAKGIQPIFFSFMEKHRPQVGEYEKLLGYPQFVDETPVSLQGTEKPQWLFYMDLHKIGSMHIIDLLLKGNADEAYTFWLKMFEQDISLLKSARGLLTHMIAISNIKGDLSLLDGIRQFSPSVDLQGKIQQALLEFDPGPIDLHRALVTEYLLHLSTANTLSEGKGLNNFQGSVVNILFNRSIYMRDVNNDFRRWAEIFAMNPKNITPEIVKKDQESIPHLSLPPSHPGFIWWLFHPPAKYMRSILTVNIISYLQEFDDAREKIQKQKAQLLSGPLFPSIPETQKTETQKAESLSAETHPAESHPAETKPMDPAEIQREAL
jgi:hypothetical protein